MNSNKKHFTIPENYFDTLASRIQDKISDPDTVLKGLGISNDLPFQVPIHYFENLSIKLKNKAQPKKLVLKTFSNYVLTFKPVIRYSIAASIALFIIFSGIKIRNSMIQPHLYSISNVDDRLKYKYGVDDGVLEDELVNTDLENIDQNGPMNYGVDTLSEEL